MSERTKPGVAFWTTVVVVTLVAYPLSIGPFVWLEDRALLPSWSRALLQVLYWPVIWLNFHDDGPIGQVIQSYIELWMR